MMSDLQGLITKSTSVTFQHIITPSFPPLFSLAATIWQKEAIPSNTLLLRYGHPWLWVTWERQRKTVQKPLYII